MKNWVSVVLGNYRGQERQNSGKFPWTEVGEEKVKMGHRGKKELESLYGFKLNLKQKMTVAVGQENRRRGRVISRLSSTDESRETCPPYF